MYDGSWITNDACPTCGFNGAAQPLRDTCTYCNGTLLDDPASGYFVCSDCGLEQGTRILPTRTETCTKEGEYKRKFYLNEALKQWRRSEPVIPDDLFAYIRKAYETALEKDKDYWKKLNREKVHALCRSICTVQTETGVRGLGWTRLDPDDSERFAAKTGTPLTNFRKFGEKWRSIIYRLTGKGSPTPPPELIQYVCSFYRDAERAFLRTRHSPNCDGRKGCHRAFGCRYSMIALNYVVKKALVSYYQGDKTNPNYKTYKRDWPKLSRDRRKKIKQRYWYPICEIAGPEFDLWLADKKIN